MLMPFNGDLLGIQTSSICEQSFRMKLVISSHFVENLMLYNTIMDKIRIKST